nr:hypothetical protein [Acidobacteriota bacterium]
VLAQEGGRRESKEKNRSCNRSGHLTVVAHVAASNERSTVNIFERHAKILALVLVLIASARIAATWRVFNATTDEPAHIACGMEWLDRQTYRLEDQHPPLARVAAALGPYLFGIRSPRNTGQDLSRQGAAILLAQGRLDRNLASARAGILPFFWIACVVVFLWARRILGSTGGLLALLLFTNVQPVLAHAALATTDMALTGTLGAAVLSTLYWLENTRSLSRRLCACCFGMPLPGREV